MIKEYFINIVGDDALLDKLNNTNNKIRKVLKENYKAIFQSKNILNKLESDIKKYPDVPPFKNQLELFYSKNNEDEKAIETNKLTREIHPEYLFGIINYALILIGKKEYSEARNVLGYELQLQSLYPNRDKFHTSEFVSYNQTVAKYLMHTNDLEQALLRLELIKKITPLDNDALATYYKIKTVMPYFKLFPNSTFDDIPEAIVNADEKFFIPKYQLKEIQNILEKTTNEITQQDIDTIHKLNRTQVIADLELCIDDVIYNQYYYLTNIDDNHNTDKILIAFFLLRELKSYQSLAKIIQFLECDNETVDCWLGITITEDLWLIFYDLFDGNEKSITNFIHNKNIEPFFKCGATRALVQHSKTNAKTKEFTINLFSEVLTKSINNKDNISNNEIIFNTIIVGNIIDLNATELLPLVEDIYVYDLVDRFMEGDYEEVLAEIEKPIIELDERLTILEFFNKKDKLYSNDNYIDDEYDYDDNIQIPYYSNKPNIGRNDPCICGSGKKFKICCIDKFQ